MVWRCFGLVFLVGLSACGGDEAVAPLVVEPGCNPLASEHDCLLPYPSDFYLTGAAGARQVTIPERALVRDSKGRVMNFLADHPADGFSVGNQILALFPQGIDEAGLVGPTVDPSASLEPESATVLLEVPSGRRVLHMAEVDPRPDDVARKTLVIRPLERLKEETRYVVALRGLRDPSGAALPAPEGFRRLRDGVDDPALAAFERYESDVFGPLSAAGLGRAELQLAWDFTTRSRDDAIGDMLSVRQQVIEHFAAAAPAVTVVEVIDTPGAGRQIEATITVPLFMEDPEPFAELHRQDGEVRPNGTVEVPITILIPESVVNRPAGSPAAPVVQFGHGFFGRRTEILDVMAPIADERGWVLVSADWWGMMADDRSALIEVIGQSFAGALGFVDRVHQAMANFTAVGYALAPLAELPEMQIAGEPAIDPGELYFYGISLGAILGATHLALSPHVDHGALSVGGANFSFMMFRAGPFAPFLLLLALSIPDPVDQQKYVALSQTTFDRIDPLSFAPFLVEPLAGGPEDKRVLSQIGIGDIAVPNLAAHLLARAMELEHLSPAPRPIPGLEAREGPLDRAIVEYDFGVDPPLLAIPPIEDNGVHGGVRELDAVNEQLDAFFAPDGRIVHTCDDICDPQ